MADATSFCGRASSVTIKDMKDANVTLSRLRRITVAVEREDCWTATVGVTLCGVL